MSHVQVLGLGLGLAYCGLDSKSGLLTALPATKLRLNLSGFIIIKD